MRFGTSSAPCKMSAATITSRARFRGLAAQLPASEMTFGDRRAALLDKLPASGQSWVQLQRVGTMEEVYQVAQNFVRVHNLDRHIKPHRRCPPTCLLRTLPTQSSVKLGPWLRRPTVARLWTWTLSAYACNRRGHFARECRSRPEKSHKNRDRNSASKRSSVESLHHLQVKRLLVLPGRHQAA